MHRLASRQWFLTCGLLAFLSLLGTGEVNDKEYVVYRATIPDGARFSVLLSSDGSAIDSEKSGTTQPTSKYQIVYTLENIGKDRIYQRSAFASHDTDSSFVEKIRRSFQVFDAYWHDDELVVLEKQFEGVSIWSVRETANPNSKLIFGGIVSRGSDANGPIYSSGRIRPDKQPHAWIVDLYQGGELILTKTVSFNGEP